MYQISVKQYDGSCPIREEVWKLGEGQEKEFTEIPCRVQYDRSITEEGEHFVIRATATQDMEKPFSVAFEAVVEDWKRTEYVFMPAAAYDGNRMESVRIPYPSYHVGKTENGWEPFITDIPHLDKQRKDSAIQLLSGDMSCPVMGYFDEETKRGLLFLGRHQIQKRYTGFTVREKETRAEFSISCPGVREKNTYYFGELPNGEGFYPTCAVPSDDEGILLKKGESIAFEVLWQNVEAENLNGYFTQFNRVRETLEKGEDFDSIPFSKAFEEIKEKYIKMNFTEEGYYRVGTENTAPPSFWQSGWTGGGMNSYPLLMEDQGLAHKQSISTLRFIVEHLQRENGWYIPMYKEGKAYGDIFFDTKQPVALVRKNADLLYFLLKQAMYLKEHQEMIPGLEESMRAQADAFVRFFEKYGELGQFLRMDTEELLEGGTACGAIAPAALALAYEYFENAAYLNVAEKLGEQYLTRNLRKGILNGGPGEICQAPDSESAFAYLESCVQLYETTGKEMWLEAAKEAFELAITWVVSYDFAFPEDSMAKRMGAHSRGTVFANAQNKHSAPGICTLSGNSMLKLYRYTGEERYLEWMGRISHALSQFVSLKERPVGTLEGKSLPAGYINERVQTSDWEGKHTVGEFLYGSNWPEVSMLLTYVEIPGIYVDLDRDLIRCSDHVRAQIVRREKDAVVLKIQNKTVFDSTVTILADHSERRDRLGHLYFEKMEKVKAAAGETSEVTIAVK